MCIVQYEYMNILCYVFVRGCKAYLELHGGLVLGHDRLEQVLVLRHGVALELGQRCVGSWSTQVARLAIVELELVLGLVLYLCNCAISCGLIVQF